MKDSIYTIPISEVFEPKSGCPLCALRSTLEERWVDYITGAAMMEPDVRIETNKHGFCQRHYNMTLERRNRLSVALMLQSRLEYIDAGLDKKPDRNRADKLTAGSVFRRLFRGKADSGTRRVQNPHGCFVCAKMDGESLRIARNIASVWAKDADFRQLYSEQEFICHTHTGLLIDAAHSELTGDALERFITGTAGLTRKRLRLVKADIDAFCNLFDYRSAHSPHPGDEVARAVENAIEYLNGVHNEPAKKSKD